MVSFEEIPETEAFPPSQERLLDAIEIEQAASKLTRPTARMHLEGLAKKLRKESDALKRVETSRRSASEAETTATAASNSPTVTATPPVPAAAAPVLAPAAPAPVFTTASSSKRTFVSIDRFSFDAGGYDAPFVTVYVGLPSVGSMARDLITCDFSASSFDLIVKDLNGKSYRLYKDNLEKDIDPAKSKILVKADKIILKLAKVKQGDYGGFDYWSELTDKKRSAPGSKKKADPQSSIMDLMKEMYDSGDDKMKKVIGETMMKQQQGGLDKKFGKDDLGDLEDSF